MSTNILQIPKLKGGILLFSGLYLFFVTLLLTPFVTFPIFSTPETTTKLFLVSSAGILALFQLFLYVPKISRSLTREFPKFVKALLLVLFVLYITGILFAPSPSTALFGMYSTWEQNLAVHLVYGILFTAWYVYFHLVTHLKLQWLLFHTLMTALIFAVAIYGIGSYHFWNINNTYVSDSVARLSLSFRNPLLAAYFIGMLASYQFSKALTFLIQDSSTKKRKLLSLFGNIGLYIGISYVLLLTFTRSAWIAFAAVAFISILFTAWMYKKNSNDTQALFRILLSAFVLLLAIFPFAYLHRSDIEKRNTDILSESQATLSAIADTVGDATETQKALSNFYQESASYSSGTIRLLEWKWGLKTAFANPKNLLLGTGSDNLYFEMPKYRDAVFNNIPIDSAVKPFYIRNIYLTFLVEHGILSLLAVFGLLFVSKKTFLNALSHSELTLEQKLFLVAPVSVIVAFFVQGVFYYSTVVPTVLVLFVLSFTLVQVTDFGKISLRKPTLTEKILFVLLAAILIAWSGTILKAERILSFYKVSPLPPDVTLVEKNAKLPLNNNILKRYLVYLYPAKASARTYMTSMLTSNDPDDLRITSDALYKLAKDYGDTQALLDSIETTNRLLTITPTYPVPWDERGLRYLYLGNFEEARTSFLKAIELKSDYWYAYMHMGEVSRQQCNPTEALDWYKKAEAYIPSAQTEINEALSEIAVPREECQ